MVISVKPEYLAALVAVERNGSLSAAAAELGMTVSSVSYSVRQLEDNLGQPLLNREGYRVSLTPAGRTALEYASQILSMHASLSAHVTQVGAGWERELRIAFTNMLRDEVLYQWLSDFYALNSGTRIRVSREVYQGTWDALYDQRVDLVLGAIGRPPHEVDIEYLPVGRQQLLLVMHRQHPLAVQISPDQPVTTTQLAEHRLVDAGDSSRLIEPDNGLQGRLSEALLVPDLFAQREAILSGIALGFMPEHLIRQQLGSGELTSRAVHNRDNSTELYVAWRKSAHGLALSWFKERLQHSSKRQMFL